MKQIKFRAWDKRENNWVDYPIYIDANGDVYWEHYERGLQEADDLIVMQSAGLVDKNGVEIFEGDLVRFTNGIDEIDNEVGKVVWEQSECNFVAQYKTTNRATQKENGTTKTIYLISNEIYRKDVEYEVIGNIYENIYENSGLMEG